MKMPWHRSEPETRDYTSAVTAAIEAAAAGQSQRPSCVEIAAGQVSRAFASGDAAGADAGLFTATVLGRIGRDLIRAGESVWLARRGRLRYVMRYTINENGFYHLDSPAYGRDVNPNDMFHVRYAVNGQTLRGVAPIDLTPTLRDMLLHMESQIRDEANTPTGYLLPIPVEGDEVDALRNDLSRLAGQVALVKTATGGWDQGRASAPRREYEPIRFGMRLPDSTVVAYRDAQRMALAAMGVPTGLIDPEDGTGQREAWRRFLHGTIQPLARLVEAAAASAGLGVALTFDALMASDIAGRARAFQSLVGAGMDIEAAAAATGLITEE